ncbi:1623_t:CDS:2 [Dentiscutata heterogama]|uniref:1623_t:CDS:1 n=1 Tax=Dentiscutata heterogama TaxID=1316150 RepID=A0ACA9N996_9GLOM|nr:1623_t:CDS:2 [Dentiscutata heterogama]
MNSQKKCGRWDDQEKQLLQSLVQTHGYNWRAIAMHMGQTRDQRQIREHYLNHQNPAINKRRITPSESEKIQELYRKHGRQWKLIASYFPCFSPIMVRNHWNNLQRKRMNQIRSLRRSQQPDHSSFGNHPVAYPQFGSSQQQPTTLAPPSDNIRKKMSITYLLN